MSDHPPTQPPAASRDLFLSYNSRDREAVLRVWELLQRGDGFGRNFRSSHESQAFFDRFGVTALCLQDFRQFVACAMEGWIEFDDFAQFAFGAGEIAGAIKRLADVFLDRERKRVEAFGFAQLRPRDRMMDSLETIEPRFFLMASLMRSLWRSWSMMPLRWSDQSLRWTDILLTS